ncbi:MAG: HAD-IC family P-type ATPase, partial [Bacteroidales bacterium]
LESGTRQKLEKILLELEKRSEHPLASAIVDYLQNNSIIEGDIPDLQHFTNHAGSGIQSGAYWAGNLNFAEEQCKKVGLSDEAGRYQQEGKTIVMYGVNEKLLAVIAVADKIKESSLKAVKELKNSGIEVYMLTGDNNFVASSVARQLGIDHFKAGTLPSDKEEYVKSLQRAGKTVAMVGDGINDSQALARADVSIAMGRGTDIAMDVAMMTLITSDLQLLPKAFALSKKTVRLIHQNLFWAFIYNLIGIPIAAGLLYPFTGILLNPMIAAAAMAFSSVSVVLNSLRLGKTTF